MSSQQPPPLPPASKLLRVTPLYGSQYNMYGEAEEPTCTMMELSNCRILINMGYHSTFWNISNQNSTSNTNSMNNNNKNNNSNDNDDDHTTPISTHTNHHHHHDCVLIMNSTWQCCGGLPLYYEYMQQLVQHNVIASIPPIYATHPTIKMGQMTLYEYQAALAMDGGGGGGGGGSSYSSYTSSSYTSSSSSNSGGSGNIPRPLLVSLSSIDNVFNSIVPIKYNQHIYISPSSHRSQQQESSLSVSTSSNINQGQQLRVLSVTAHRAGYVVGAAYYIIQRLMDETNIMYTDSTYHMSKELHLEPCTLLQQQQYSSNAVSSISSSTSILPDVLITRPGGPAFRQFRALYTNQMNQFNNNNSNDNNNRSNTTIGTVTNNNKNSKGHNPKQQSSSSSLILPAPPMVQQAERNLMELIMSVLRREGHVLLPTDTSGRILELLLLLVREWEQHKYYTSYSLIYYGTMCHNVLSYAKSQLEWMAQNLNNQFTDHGQHPYRFAHHSGGGGSNSNSNRPIIHFCTSLSELNAIVFDANDSTNTTIIPCCIIASGLTMEGGPSRDVLLKLADNPDNAIVFTDTSQCYLRKTYYGTTTMDNSNIGSAATATKSGAIDDAVTIESGIEASTRNSTLLNTDDSGIITVPNSSTTTTNSSINPPSVSIAATGIGPTKIIGGVNRTTIETTNEEDNEDAAEDVTNIGEALGHQDSKSIWTTAGQLLQAYATAKAMGTEMADSITIDVNVPIRAPLAGNELKLFLEHEEAKRQEYIRAAEKRAMLAQVELAKGQLHLGEDDTATNTTTVPPTTSSSSALDTTKQPTNAVSSSTITTTATVSRSRPRKKSRFDSTLFLKFSKPLYMTFDIREEAVGLGQPDSIAKYGIGETVGRSGEILEDDYGISVQPQRFTDIISGVDPSKFASGTGRIGDDRRGFGYDMNTLIGKSKSSSKVLSNSSRVVSDVDDQDDDDELDEQVQEALDLSEGTGIIRGRNGRLPMKVSTVTRKIEVLAEISYMPGLEGRVDARAARQSVRALQPREVIVLGGSRKDSMALPDGIQPILISDEVRLLAEASTSFVKGSKIVATPSDGETVELDVGHAAYSVRLINKPYIPANMPMETDGMETPASVETVEMKLGSCNVSLLNCVATGQKVALDGSIVLAPRVSSSSLDETTKRPSIYLSDGEILLTDLRAELIALGMKAEYSAHTGYSQLLINGKIVLKKEQNNTDNVGRMRIEGPLCEDFYTVRSILAGQYVVF